MVPPLESTLARYYAAKTARGTFEWHWQEVADLILPTRSFNTFYVQGAQRRNRIFDSTAPNALESLAAAVHGLLTNPAIRWMSLTLEDYDDATDESASQWLYDTTNRLLSFFASPASGFATACHEEYLDEGAFGTAALMIRETPASLRFIAKELSGMYALEGQDGYIQDYFYRFEMSARDVMVEFGSDLPGPSERVRKLAEDPKSQDEKVELLHAVNVRLARDPTSPMSIDMPWSSRYIELQAKHMLSEGGFNESPYLMPRWSKGANEVYGRGPGMQALPAIKGANAMRRDTLIAAEQAVRPPVNVFANSVEGPLRTAPGSINYLRSGTRDLPMPMQLGAQPLLGKEMVADVRVEIESAFYLDILKLPERDRMTAEEIITRRQQGLIKASPVVSRLIAESLTPKVRRAFNWHLRTGRLLPPPPSLRGRQLRVDYSSPMVQSQKASSGQSIGQAFQAAIPLIQVDPGVLGNIDADATFRALWSNAGADPRLLRHPRDVAAQREQTAQQQQLAQAAKPARDYAAAAKDVSAIAAPP